MFKESHQKCSRNSQHDQQYSAIGNEVCFVKPICRVTFKKKGLIKNNWNKFWFSEFLLLFLSRYSRTTYNPMSLILPMRNRFFLISVFNQVGSVVKEWALGNFNGGSGLLNGCDVANFSSKYRLLTTFGSSYLSKYILKGCFLGNCFCFRRKASG